MIAGLEVWDLGIDLQGIHETEYLDPTEIRTATTSDVLCHIQKRPEINGQHFERLFQ